MKRRIFTALFVALVACLTAVTFAGCVIPWYIPVKYGAKKMEKIYEEIERLLTERDSYYVSLSYKKEGEDTQEYTSLNVCKDDGEYCLVWYDFDKNGFTAYYADGQYFYYDKATQEETVREADISEFTYYLEAIDGASDYISTVYRDWYDGYCYNCVPWGFGWAMVYYHTDFTFLGEQCENMSGSWDIDHSVGFITNLEFHANNLYVTFNGADSDGPIHKLDRMKPIMKDTYEEYKTVWFEDTDGGKPSDTVTY